MKMKKLFLVAIGLLFAGTAWAQDSIIPLDYANTNTEQYYKFEQNFIDCTNWFIYTPLTQPDSEITRQAIMRFLGTWIEASPTVYIELNEDVMCFCGESPELTMAYLMGYTSTLLDIKKAAGTLNTPTEIGSSSEEKLAGSVGGIVMAGKFYEINKENLGRNRNMEKFMKMHKEGTLTNHINGMIR